MSEMVFCRGCGKEIHNTAISCPACGAPQRAAGGGKNKVVAALLAFFLGAFGIHRFYLGKWWGVFYLLFFWTFIPGIVAFVETIVFLLTSDEAWDAKYNNGIPSSGGSGAAIVIAVVCGVFGIIFIIGILAAIAIPAYSDYVAKAKLVAVERDSEKITSAFNDYFQKNRSVPSNIEELGVTLSNPGIRSIDIDQQKGVISLTLSIAQVDGKHFLLIPHEDANQILTWNCGSDDIKAALLPKNCR